MTDNPDNPNDETPEQDKKPKAERKMPKWMPLFYKTIHKHWQHHAPCEHINLMSEWSDETKCWHVNAAPVWQEILGGEDDGKRVWAGFLFDFGDFSRAEGVWVQEQAFMSVCSECTPYPKTMTKGKFRGHNFYLHLFLEPPQETEAVEVIDTIKKEIRNKMAPVSDPGENDNKKA